MGENGSVKVSSLFTPKEVLCGLKAISREKCIRMLAEQLRKAEAIADEDETVKAILEREELGNTIVTPGLAVPHARLDSQEKVVIAVATSREGIEFGPEPKGAAKLVVMIVTGAEAPGIYLQVLAAVVRAFADTSLIGKVAMLDTPDKVWEFFDKGAGMLPEFVTAADMMSTRFVKLRHTDTLADAIDCFCRHHIPVIPVLDDDGDFVGVVGEAEVLTLSLPEYILWMEDLGPILQFEPFAQTLKDENITRVAEIMSKEFVTVEEETPAIHVARELMRQDVRQVFVVRGKKLVGIITLSHLLQRVFRG